MNIVHYPAVHFLQGPFLTFFVVKWMWTLSIILPACSLFIARWINNKKVCWRFSWQNGYNKHCRLSCSTFIARWINNKKLCCLLTKSSPKCFSFHSQAKFSKFSSFQSNILNELITCWMNMFRSHELIKFGKIFLVLLFDSHWFSFVTFVWTNHKMWLLKMLSISLNILHLIQF